MKVLITGGLGFQGLYLIKLLLKNKNEVVVINTKTDQSWYNFQQIKNKADLKVYWHNLNPSSLAESIKGCSVFIHFANGFLLNDGKNLLPPPKKIRNKNLNAYPLAQILELARDKLTRSLITREKQLITVLKKSQIKKIIFISSASVYSHFSKKPIKENSALRPKSYYGFSKIILEKLYSSSFNNDDEKLVIIRPFNIYGPLQEPNRLGSFIISSLIAALSNETIIINGKGDQLRDPLYIDDVARAYYKIITSLKCPLLINIGSGRPLTLKKIIQTIKDLTKSQSRIEYDKTIQDGSVYADISNLKKIDFKPKIDFRSGIKKVISSMSK